MNKKSADNPYVLTNFCKLLSLTYYTKCYILNVELTDNTLEFHRHHRNDRKNDLSEGGETKPHHPHNEPHKTDIVDGL